jgi:tetratricopeptide (TPR) repeat protein
LKCGVSTRNSDKMDMKRSKLFAILLLICFSTLSVYAQNDEARRHWVRAETALKMGLLQDAVNEYKEAIVLDSTNGSFYYNLALVQEKMGTSETFSDAIKNYKEYLRLIPDCNDREQVINKIYAIEFQLDEQKKMLKQVENLKGIWRSDWHFEESGVPFWFFDIDLIDSDVRLTVLENSGLYRPDFTYKTVTIPYDKNIISFAFTNDTKHEAQNNETEHALVDIMSSQNSSISTLSPLFHGLLSSTATAAYQTVCTYIFKLKISNDSLYGTVHIIEKRIDAGSNKVVQDNVQYISFNKSDLNYRAMTKEEKKEKKIEGKKKKENLTTSFSIDYAIPQGITAATNVNDSKSGFMTKGGGINVSFFNLPIMNSDSIALGTKKNKRLHLSFGGGDGVHYYQISTPYGLNIETSDSYGYAKTVSRTTGSTSAGDIEIGCHFGMLGALYLSRNCFCDFEISPLGASANMIITYNDKIDMIALINYNYYLSVGLNFFNKCRNANGVFVSYSGGSPFAYITSGKGENANVYALEKPKIDVSVLHIGYKHTF